METILLALTLAITPAPTTPCGSFNTQLLKQDIELGRGRTDREWQETIIKTLVFQLECERQSRGV